MPKINGDRLLGDLKHIRTYGATGTGVVRLSFSEIDMESRRWLLGRMKEAGLDASIDGIGNVIGMSRSGGKALLMGSHTDTQPRGGWLDGVMGVIYALEVARALSEDPETKDLAVDIASWMDEESTYAPLLGSRSFCGQLTEQEIAEAKSLYGQSLAEAISGAGLEGIERAQMDHDRYVGYLEAHIEQGGVLEHQGKRIGVVTSIVGIRNFLLTFKGQQNHAGTTPMPIRKDAGIAALMLGHDINVAYKALTGDRTVWTLGRVLFDPNAPSIVPGGAEMTVQFRDPEMDRLDAFEAKLRELVDEANARRPVEITMQSDVHKKPAPMHEPFQEHIVQAAETHASDNWIRMPSGAGHDAMVIADEMPAAMLFVPSIGGISHDFAEDTADDDIVLGCQVFTDAAALILKATN